MDHVIFNSDISEHLLQVIANGRTVPQSILNVGDSISNSDCFLWHERTRINSPGMLSSEGYRYLPKKLCCKSGMESGWGREHIDQALEQGNPELATILYGSNDLLHGKKDPDKYEENLRYIIDACIAKGTVPILFTIPTGDGVDDELLKIFNQRVYSIVETKHLPLIDTWKIFQSHGGYEKLTSDGIHPNVTVDGKGGYDYINPAVRYVYKQIESTVLKRTLPIRNEVLLQRVKDNDRVVEHIDRNNDGKADLWRVFVGGALIEERYDSDFDGIIDVWWEFVNGQLQRGREDLCRDGQYIVSFEMKDGWKNEVVY